MEDGPQLRDRVASFFVDAAKRPLESLATLGAFVVAPPIAAGVAIGRAAFRYSEDTAEAWTKGVVGGLLTAVLTYGATIGAAQIKNPPHAVQQAPGVRIVDEMLYEPAGSWERSARLAAGTVSLVPAITYALERPSIQWHTIEVTTGDGSDSVRCEYVVPDPIAASYPQIDPSVAYAKIFVNDNRIKGPNGEDVYGALCRKQFDDVKKSLILTRGGDWSLTVQ